MNLLNINNIEIEVEDRINGTYNDFEYELDLKPNECYSDYQAVLFITNDEIINVIDNYQLPTANFGSQEIWGTDDYFRDLYIDGGFIAVPIWSLRKEMTSFETVTAFIEYVIDDVIYIEGL